MSHWIIYNDASHPAQHLRGRIVSVFNGDKPSAEVCLEAHQSLIEGDADPRVHYVDVQANARADKSMLSLVLDKDTIIADGDDQAQLTGLPIPCIVKVSGEEVEVTDGSLEFSTDTAGTTRIFVSIPEYVSEEVPIYAV